MVVDYLRKLAFAKINGYHDVSKKRNPSDFSKGEANIRNQFPQKIWPGNAKCVFLLHVDDLCSMASHNADYDYGGMPEEGFDKEFKTFLAENPQVRATFFVIPAPTFYGDNQRNDKVYPSQTFSIADKKYESWRTNVARYVKKGHEIALHGLHHVQTDVRGFLPFCEFEFKDAKASTKAIDEGKKLFSLAKFKTSGFKPPAWGIGYNASFGLISALQQQDFSYVCLSSPVSGLNWKKKSTSNFFPQYHGKILNVPQNINLLWDEETIFTRIDEIVALNGIICLQVHANIEGKWMKDGLGPINRSKIRKIISYVRKATEDKIWFCTTEQIATYWRKNAFTAEFL